MKINKQSSRDANLYIFSHKHHHALIFANWFKKAQQMVSATLKKYVQYFWDMYFNSHFKKEKTFLLPHLTDEELQSQFLNEHKPLQNQVMEIPDKNEEINEKNRHLSNLIQNHIKFEEWQFSPWIQEHLSEAELRKIGKGLAHIEITADDFIPEFFGTLKL